MNIKRNGLSTAFDILSKGDCEDYADAWHKIDEGTYIKYVDGLILFRIPFYFGDSFNGLTVAISRNDDGSFLLSDQGITYDYLEEKADDVNIFDVMVDKIVPIFDVKRNKKVLYTSVPSLVTGQTLKVFYRFLQCLSLISNVNLFSLKKDKKETEEPDKIVSSAPVDHSDIFRDYLSKCSSEIKLPVTMVNPLFFKEIADDLHISVADVSRLSFYKSFVEVHKGIATILNSFVKNGYEGGEAVLQLYRETGKEPDSRYLLDSLPVPDCKSFPRLDEDARRIRFYVDRFDEAYPQLIVRNSKIMIQKSIYGLLLTYIKEFWLD